MYYILYGEEENVYTLHKYENMKRMKVKVKIECEVKEMNCRIRTAWFCKKNINCSVVSQFAT